MMVKIAKDLIKEMKEWIEFVLRNVPGRTGKVLRGLYYSNLLCKCSSSLSEGIITAPVNIIVGEKANVMRNCCLYAHSNGLLKIGSRVSVNSNVILGAADNGEITIGNDVLIGQNVVIRASNHQYKDKNIPINRQGHTGGKIIVEDDAWIGANVVVLPNITVGKGAVGAGAVVCKSIPPYCLAGGVPAKVVKENCRN